MNFEIYIKKMADLDKEVNIKKRKLKMKYALSHSTVKIGDMITDHLGSIIVESILLNNVNEPSCIYKGINLLKSGKVSKRQKKRYLYQVNLIV